MEFADELRAYTKTAAVKLRDAVASHGDRQTLHVVGIARVYKSDDDVLCHPTVTADWADAALTFVDVINNCLDFHNLSFFGLVNS